jgi:hypothetical protein
LVLPRHIGYASGILPFITPVGFCRLQVPQAGLRVTCVSARCVGGKLIAVFTICGTAKAGSERNFCLAVAVRTTASAAGQHLPSAILLVSNG